MISCDNEQCPIEWFHKTSLKMQLPLKGNGFVMIATGDQEVGTSEIGTELSYDVIVFISFKNSMT